MSSLKNSILFLVISISLSACDAKLPMNYAVKNTTKKAVQLKIKDYPYYALYSKGTDTLVTLQPNEQINVAYADGIGFPWETKKLYRKNKGVQNFWLVKNDTLITLNNEDQYWKYKRGSSVFKIK